MSQDDRKKVNHAAPWSREKKEAERARGFADQEKKSLKASFFDLENLVRQIDDVPADSHSYKESLMQAGKEFSESIERWNRAQQKAAMAVAKLLGHDILTGETPASLVDDNPAPPWEEIEKYDIVDDHQADHSEEAREDQQ